jgi:coenzyme F420-dependent glucose-6-phosphate dehydrogenase
MSEPRGLRVGYKASAEQFAPGELASFAVRAEELGLDSVTISDHFQPWRLEGGHAPNSLAWMSWVLARTERVLVGTSVMTPTFRYNPAVVAQTFATMACLAPGRVMLGVGTGEASTRWPSGRWPRGSGPSSRSASAGCARPCA